MNPSEYEIRSICLNSQFRSSGLLQNPSFVMGGDTLSNIVALKLKNACIPLTFYTIDDRNNKIYFAEDVGGSETLIGTIPDGHYTSSTFPAAIKAAMDAVGSNTYTVSFATLTSLLTITSSDTDFKFLDGVDNCNYEMGLVSDDLNSFAASIIPSEVIDLSGVKVINLVSNIKAVKVVGQNYNILASIICEEETGSISQFQDDSSDYILSYIENLDTIDLSFYDERMRKLIPRKDYSISIYFLTK